MRRIAKWIQDHKAYSNPVFGLMLTINVMVLPTFQAAAGMDEPVQSVVLNAQDVQDALDAIEAGVKPELALLEQSKPYREWGKTQKEIYETLFVSAYDMNDAVYVLDNETIFSDEFSVVSGSTVTGDEFSLRYVMLQEYDYLNDADLPDIEVNSLAEVGASLLNFIGTMSTPDGSLDIFGFVMQASREDGGRNRSVVILGTVEPIVVEALNDLHIHATALTAPISDDAPIGILDCAHAFGRADIAYDTAIELAKSDLQTCFDLVMSGWIKALGVCAGGGALAAALASPSGPGAFVVGMYTGLACGLGASIAAMAEEDACEAIFAGAVRAARINRNGAYELARLEYGVNNCPVFH